MPEPSQSLARVRRAAVRRRRADLEYRSAVIEAAAALAATGSSEPFAVVGRAAGCSKQAVRQMVLREARETT